MRWVAGLVFLLGLYLGAAHFSGGAFPTLGLPIGGDRALLRQTTDAFIEDIKFKDFKKAASYHAPDKRDAVDIPFLIERLFVQKPESLDIMSYEIMMSEIDSTNMRGRVKSNIKVKNLAVGEIREQELMLFYHRDSVDAPWYMELESSLRQLSGDKQKQH